jgi:signal transduction histidine kinase
VLRYAYSAASARKAAQRERTLSRFAAELLQGGERDAINGVAERAASELIGGGKTVIVAPDDPSASAEDSLAVPVMVAGEEESVLVVERRDAEFLDTQAALGAVAAQLAMAVERQRLLAREQEAARALNEQMERLRELDVMKDQFVSSVSHELRTPLTSIVGYNELLLDGEAGELSEDQEHFLGIIGRNCDRLTRLVDDILFVARVDAGRLSLDLQDIDIVDVVTKTVESAGPVAARKDLTLKLDAETDRLELHADPVRIGELMDNLMSNAIKFTPEGGVVTVRRRA